MHTCTAAAPIAAVLEIPAGRIRLIAADRNETTVEVLPADPASKRDAKAAEHTAVSYADGTLRIEAAPAAHRALGRSGAVEITVQLPAGSHIQAKLATGEVRGVGRLGDATLDATTTYGRIRNSLNNTTGPDPELTVRATTSHGDITARSL